MARFTTGNTFGTTDTVTATTLNNAVNNAALAADSIDNSTIELNSNALRLKDAGITTAKIADSSSKTTGVTFAKMQHISTAQVLGRLSASEGDVEEVGVVIGGSGDAGVLFDNDDMLDNSDTAGGSATRGATQQSIKAYVDGGGGFTPASYTSGESVTLPNGLIMKTGLVTAGANSATDVNFAESFSGTISAQLTIKQAGSADANQPLKVESLANDKLQVRNTSSGSRDVYWLVIGH